MPPCNNDCEPLPELQAADPLQRLATVTIPWLGISAGGHERHMIPLGQSHPWMASCLASGLSVAPAAALTNPFDVVKVRRQLQAVHCTTSYGTLGLARHIARNEGYGAFWYGASAAAWGGLCYGGCRIGLYQPIKEQLRGLPVSDGMQMVTAGLVSGSLAAVIFNPLELVKTRMQSKANRLQGPAQVIRAVLAEQGFAGLWKGAGPSVVFWSIMTASQCATYDTVKAQVIRRTGWDDSSAAQLATSVVTGVVTTTATAPVDMLKSRMFVGGESCSGTLAVARDILRNEGVHAFFHGWTAQYLRLGPQTVITFMFLEHLQRALGMGSF